MLMNSKLIRSIRRTNMINILVIGLPVMLCVQAALPGAAYASETCGGAHTSYISCNAPKKSDTIEGSSFWWLIQYVLGIAVSLVGIVAVAGIVWGSILYASAQGNEQQVERAKTIIRDVVIGLVLFILMYAILQYLLPGGIF